MRKIQFTEHQVIAVLKSVEAGRTIKMCTAKLLFPKPVITIGKQHMAGRKPLILKISKILRTRIVI